MEIFYANNRNEKIYLDREPYKMLSSTSLFDYEWEHTTQGSTNPRITRFSQTMKEKDFVIRIFGNSIVDFKEKSNRLLSVFEKDIFDLSPGKLYVGGWYLRCYISKSKKPKRYLNAKTSLVEVSVTAENGMWTKEAITSFGKITNEVYNRAGLDYAYDYSFDYSNSLTSQLLVNENYAPADFELTIFGACENPAISIGLHTYAVNDSLSLGEYIKVNSRTRKIYKVKNNGEKVNIYDRQGREFWIFEKIPSGNLIVAWSGGFGFEIALLEERSEPRWI
ncbi:MAG: hypothetical protein NC307_13200 [Roseburia sp.]|nr:hypothetical protein [Roseburia sp.]